MAVYGSMLVPTKSASTSSTKGYTTQTSYTAGQNSSARLSDSAGSIIQQAANSQTNALAGLTTNLHRANDALTDAYIDHNKMVGQNMATEYRQRVNDALYGENGILTREGESTFTCRKDAEAEMKKISDELQQGMSGSIAANFFRQNTDAFISDMSVKAQQYQDKMYGKWQDDGQTAYISQSLDLALNNYKNPDAFSRHLAEATSTIRAMGKRNGVHTDMIEKNVRDNVSNTFLNAVKQALGDKDLASAQRILKQGMTTYRDPNPHDLSNPDGLEKKATADFNNRKVFRTKDADGNEVIKTVQTMTLETDDGKFIVLPTIIDGKEFTPEDAIAYSKKTGEHFGVFDTQAHADDFAQKLHENHAVQYGPGRVYMKPADITSAKALVQHEIDRRAAEAERARARAERQRASEARKLLSKGSYGAAYDKAVKWGDYRDLFDIYHKLDKLGFKGEAESVLKEADTMREASFTLSQMSSLPIPEAGKMLESLESQLRERQEAGDIHGYNKIEKLVSEGSKVLSRLVSAEDKQVSSMLSSKEYKDAAEFAYRGDTYKLSAFADKLESMGRHELAAKVKDEGFRLAEQGLLSTRAEHLTPDDTKSFLDDLDARINTSTDLDRIKGLEKVRTFAEKNFSLFEKGEAVRINKEAKELTSGDTWDNAIFYAVEKGDFSRMESIASQLETLGLSDVSDKVHERIIDLQELKYDKDKLGKGTIEQQRKALAAFKTSVDDSVTAEDFTQRDKVYGAALKQLQSRIKERDTDPGLFAAQILNAETDEASKGTLSDELLRRVDIQRENGVLPDRTMPLSKAEVEDHVSNFNTSDDKSAYLKSIEKQYGEAWPMVYRQLAQSGKFPKTFQLINNLPSYPASIVAQAGNNSSYFSSMADARNMPKTDRDYLKTSVRTALSPAIRTLTLAGDTPNATMVEDVACNLAVTYVSQDIPPSVAAKRAADEVMNDRYNIIGTYRVPKEFDSGKVKQGVDNAISNLLEYPERFPLSKEFKNSVSQFSPDVAKSKMRYEIRRHLIVTTNSDESGVDFRFDGMLLRDGMSARSVSYSFNDLMNLKRERGPLTEREKMSDEAKAVRPWH